MRKLALFILPILLVSGLAACGDDDDDTTASSTETSGGGDTAFESMEEGVLIVGTELPAPPFWEGEDYDNLTGGYEVDLAMEIAARLGIDEVRFVEMPFGGLVAGQECPCDFDLGQVTITEERAEVVDFSTAYFDANQGVMVNPGTEVASAADAKALTWGAQLNTTGLFYLTDTLQVDAEPQVYNTVVDLFNALQAGQVDAVMMDTPIVLGEAAQEGNDFEVVGQFATGEQYGAVLAKDSPNTAVLSAVIDELREDGFLDELGAEYFNDPASVPFLE